MSHEEIYVAQGGAVKPSAFDMMYPSQSRGAQCPVPTAAACCQCCACVCRAAIRTAMLLRAVRCVLAMGCVLAVSRVAHVSKNYKGVSIQI